MEPITWQKGDYQITTDREKMDIDCIHSYLSKEAYWASNIPHEIVERSVNHSLCFGIFTLEKQVGFCRVVTDFATFAWLSDVFILSEYRGQGLAKWMIDCVLAYPELTDLRMWLLATRDAHGLYAKYGFQEVDAGKFMVIRKPNPYG
jgi:GNAT superfamily N-acetyltransferase